MEEPEGDDLDAGQGQDGLSEQPLKVTSSLTLDAEHLEVEEKESVSEITATATVPPEHPHILGVGMIDSIIPESDSVIPESESIIPESDSVIPESDSIIPESESIIPESESIIPESESIIPESDSIIPESGSVIPESESIIPESDSVHVEQDPASQYVPTTCSTIIPENDSVHAEQDQGPTPQGVQAACSTMIQEGDSVVSESESIIPESDSFHAEQAQGPALQYGDTMLACPEKFFFTQGVQVQMPEGKTEFNDTILSSSLPSYLSETTDRAVHNESLLSGKEDLNSQGPSHPSLPSSTSSFNQSPSKSKLELNVSVEDSASGPSELNTLLLSKSSLNFQLSDYAARGREDRAALSDSETRKPRTRFRSAPSRRRAKSTTEAPESNCSHTRPLPAWVPRLDTAVHREAAASQDGRHALNYGPATALDDMLSDIRMLSQESESEIEIETFDPEVIVPSPADIVGVRQRRARTQRRPEKKGGRRRKKRKHDLDEMDNGEEGTSTPEMPSLLRCPVCLDVFYNAHSLSPCGHVFCEPCLRHLAKCSRDAMRETTCPVCRDLIESCSPNTEITGLVEFYRADDYSRRHRLEKNNKYMRHPLPSSYPDIFSPKHQLSRIVSRLDRTRLARRRTRIGTSPIRLNFWRFVSLAFAFIVLKGLLLMVMLCLYCVVYDHGLHEKMFEVSLSGVFGFFRYLAMLTPKLWGFAGVFLFGVMFVVVLKYGHCAAWLKPLHDNQRTAF